MYTMKKIISLFPVLLMIIILGSCTVYKKSVPQAGVQAQVNINLNDLEYIKDVKGTATQSYVLGLPIGGTKYKSGVVANYAGSLPSLPSVSERGVNTAMYNALQSASDADFILPLSMEIQSNRMFMGREDSIVVKAKAFKIKKQ